MWFRKRKAEDEPFDRPEPPGEITLRPIGLVRNQVARPRPKGWERVESTVEILPEHEPKLKGLRGFSHVIVVFYMDLAPTAPEHPDTLRMPSGNDYGIFATRSQLRPNHLGVSAVELLGVEGTAVRVRGLDAIHGTPVLDIKPYLPEYDAHPKARIPPA